MTEPFEYLDPPQCREDGCKSRPVWRAETDDRKGEEYTDYLCGRHLAGFLSLEVFRPGDCVVLIRRERHD